MRLLLLGVLALVPGAGCGAKTAQPVPATGSALPLPPTPAASATSTTTATEAQAAPSAGSPPARRPGAYAFLGAPVAHGGPPDALADCEGDLARAGVTFHPYDRIPVHEEHGSVCGTPQAVVYVKGPGAISYEPSPVLSCPMALALASFEHVIQQEADRAFHAPVVRVQQLGTYVCRKIAAFRSTQSEHSYANAIDLAEFVLKDGRRVSVLKDFFKGDGEPTKPGGMFLSAVAHRGFDEDIFSNVLTPFFDPGHKNHFHIDLARYRVDGFRPHA
jgi:hypothetical protein